jgi:C1A family cysteine protease
MFGFRQILCVAFFGVSAVARISPVERFERWVEDFRVKFESDHHFLSVYEKWVSNDDYITEVNSQNLTFSLGHNQFSGMDTEDFSEYLLLSKNEYSSPNLRREPMDDIVGLPSSVNWVTSGAVTPVKDQGQCGSCWSFSTTGALEGAYYIKYGKLQSFSEQQLVDCDTYKNGGKDFGCNGGLMDNAFSWINKNGGLCSESAYPYVSGDTKTAGTCQKSCSIVANSKVTSFVDVTPSSDSAMMTALSKQPVSVAIEADQREFQLYKSGVFTASCGTTLDHGVLAVGYGSETGGDYYLVKNSWGTSWGENGYIKLGRGSSYNKGAGQCGILLEASYPVL